MVQKEFEIDLSRKQQFITNGLQQIKKNKEKTISFIDKLIKFGKYTTILVLIIALIFDIFIFFTEKTNYFYDYLFPFLFLIITAPIWFTGVVIKNGNKNASNVIEDDYINITDERIYITDNLYLIREYIAKNNNKCIEQYDILLMEDLKQSDDKLCINFTYWMESPWSGKEEGFDIHFPDYCTESIFNDILSLQKQNIDKFDKVPDNFIQ